MELRTYLGPRPQQPPYAPLAHPAPDSNQHAHQHKPEKSAPRAPRANKYGYALQIDTCLWCRLGLKIRCQWLASGACLPMIIGIVPCGGYLSYLKGASSEFFCFTDMEHFNLIKLLVWEYLIQFTSEKFADDVAELIRNRYPPKEIPRFDDVLATFVLHHPEHGHAVVLPIISSIIDGGVRGSMTAFGSHHQRRVNTAKTGKKGKDNMVYGNNK
ncbi:protein GIGANTEA [Trifolium pratense]|uniref:Protein GIGANTEA n=1 Tax=Trifolium pratense TaxID=57577 RepID=A0A2K3MPH6_TRIPR|nr:protein GIGANTEA [Trifolium pratense]